MKKHRYNIKDWHIFDDAEPSEGFYIREILDTSSFEYDNSKLTPHEKLSIILEVGLERLITILEDCYRTNHKPYNAISEGNLAYRILTKNVESDCKVKVG